MSSGELKGKLQKLLASKHPYSVVLAEKQMTLQTLLQYSVGSVIVFSEVEADRLRFEVSGNEVARGTAVTLSSELALQLNEVRPPRDYIENILQPKS